MLDLFAGSGALGIEALSRGAAHATFVDDDRRAVARRSRPTWPPPGWPTGPPCCAARPSGSWPTPARDGERWSLALLDPPYAFDGWPTLLAVGARRSGRGRVRPPGRPSRRRGVRSGSAGTGLRSSPSFVRRRQPAPATGPIHRSDRGHSCSTPGRSTRSTTATSRSSRPRRACSTASSWRPCATRRRASRCSPTPSASRCCSRASPTSTTSQVTMFSSLVVDLARNVGADFIVKGLRAVSDFESELQMAQMNHKVSGVDTLFIPSASAHSFLASKLIREIARFGGDVSAMVPPPVAKRLEEKYAIVSDFEDDLDELADLTDAPTPTPFHGAETEEILLPAPRHHRRGPAGAAVGVVDDLQGRGARAGRRGPDPAARGAAGRPVAAQGARGVPRPRAPRGRRDPRPGSHPGRAHGAAHRGGQGGRDPGLPDHGHGRGRGPAAAPRGRGLLRPEAGQLRDRARAHHEAGGQRPPEAPGHQPAGRVRRRCRSTCRRRRRPRSTTTGPTTPPATTTSRGARRRVLRPGRRLVRATVPGFGGARRGQADERRPAAAGGRVRAAGPSRHPARRSTIDVVLDGLATSSAVGARRDAESRSA